MDIGSDAVVDLVFRVSGETLAWDHSYALFGALCRRQPRLHQGRYPLGVFPINGAAEGSRTLRLTGQSMLRLRLPFAHFGDVFPLIHAELELDGCKMKLQTPETENVPAATSLYSSWVTYSGATSEDVFLERLAQNLDKLGIETRASFVLPRCPKDENSAAVVRRVRRIKGQAVAGYALLLEDLSAAHSAIVLTHGLGGRRHFGGGLFRPARGRP